MEEAALKIEGWKKGFRIPVANEENQRLQEELEKLIIRKRNARKNFETSEERFNALKNHLKIVEQQNVENQRLLTIYKQQMDVEENQLHTFCAEKQGTLAEIRNLEKQTKEVIDRKEIKKNNMSKTLSKIEKIKAELDWDSEALNAWEESLKVRNDDNEILQKFAKEDRRKITDLEIQLKNLQTDLAKRKNVINKVTADVINNENVLEKTGKVLKELRVERTSLIKQWQEAAKNLNRQDINISKVNMETETVDKMIEDALESLEEQNKFLEEQINNNKQLEMETSEMNTKASKIRRELDEQVQVVLNLTTEVNTEKHMMIATANALENERAKGRNLAKEIIKKERKVKMMKIEIENLKTKLKEVKSSSSTAAERAKYLETLIQEQQKREAVLIQDIGRIQAQYYRTQQSLDSYHSELKQKEIEISGIQSRLISLKKETQNSANEVHKQKETVYEIDFKINHLEGKLAKLEGDSLVHSDSGVQLEKKYRELEEKLAEQTQLKNLIQRQAIVIEDEMRRLTLSLTAYGTEMGILKEKLQEQITLYEVGKKQCVVAGNMSRKKRVDENVLRLRVSQLEKTLKKEDGIICDIKKYQLEMDMIMRERLIEVGANKDIVSVKKRNLNEEKSRIKAEITGRLIKIDQLQKKYHIALMSLGKDDSGQPLSVTHFKIQKAQEKYMLQQEGDQLDNKVKKFEKEIIAMENTLKVVNSANVAFRSSVSAIDSDDEEVQEQRELQNDIFNFNSVLHKNKRRLNKEYKSIEELKEKLKSSEVEKDELEQVLNVWESKFNELQNLNEEHERKIRKCDRQIQALTPNLEKCKIDKYNKNLLIRHLQEANKKALRKLSELCILYQEVSSMIHCYLDSYNLDIGNTDTNRLSSVRDFDSQISDSSRSYPSLNSKSSTFREEAKVSSVTNVMLTFDAQLCPKICRCPEKRSYRKIQKKS